MKKQKTTKRAKRSESSSGDSSVKDMLLQVAGVFARNMFDQIHETISERVNEFLIELRTAAFVNFLIIFGAIFLFIGFANIVDFFVGIKGAGFLFIGFTMIFFGYFMAILTRKR